MKLIEVNQSNNTDVVQWLEKNNIHNYTIQPGTNIIDVHQDVEIKYCDGQRLPVQFETVTGNFTIRMSKLQTLLGFPQHITGNFICDIGHSYDRDATGGPQIVDGDAMYDSVFHSWNGFPKQIGKSLFVTEPSSLSGIHKHIKKIGGHYTYIRL